jgi:hypothetical protein
MSGFHRRLVVGIGLMAVLTSGCGGDVRNTITQQEAAKRVEEHIHAVVALLPKEARLEQGLSTPQNCDDPTDNGPRGRITESHTYQIHDLPPAEYNAYFDTIKQWWETHNYQILADSRPKAMYLWAENKNDSFRISVKSNDVGGFYVISTSPCVWPQGTPAPRE